MPTEQVPRFVDAYGPTGDWVQLFAMAPGYAGTELIVCDDGTFVTVDRWETRSAFDMFVEVHRVDYDELDERLASLTTDEAPIGRGEIL